MAMKGKWAQGIKPRNFAWIIKDRVAISERPGGYGQNHRRLRRQEEIIWIREQGFTKVISLSPTPQNLHNYDELGVRWSHVPMRLSDTDDLIPLALYPLIRHELSEGGKLLVHREELCERVVGLMAGYLRWSALVPTGPEAISIVERILHRQLGPIGRGFVAGAPRIPRNAQPWPEHMGESSGGGADEPTLASG